MLYPTYGSVDGGTEILIYGSNFDLDLGGIKCKFGTQEVDAEIIELGTLIKCTTVAAVSTTANSDVEVTVSIDGGLHYFGNNIDPDYYEAMEFTYIIDPVIVSATPQT